jgi:hypothetical protein
MRLSGHVDTPYASRVTEEIRRSLIRKVENADTFPLVALQAIRELRAQLEGAENAAIRRARELGASLEDIAEAMGITRQGVAYRLKVMSGQPDAENADETAVVDLTEAESKEESEA